MTRLPNLELLMYKAIGHLGLNKEFMEKVTKAKSDGIRTFNFQIETFPQIWGTPVQGSTLQRTERMLSVAVL